MGMSDNSGLSPFFLRFFLSFLTSVHRYNFVPEIYNFINMINVTSLNQAISALRAETQINAITPSTLGALLQTISNLLATANTASDLDALSQLQVALNNLKQKVNAYVIQLQNDPTFISHLVQGATDRNNVYLNATKVNVAFGTASTVEQAVTIKQATETRAGVMRAQQVTDLNEAKAAVNTLQTTVRNLQTQLQQIADTVSLYTHIECKANMKDGLHVCGANKLVAAGFIPYIFRYSRKKSRYRHNKEEQRRKGPKMRGWHVFCGKGKIAFEENDLMKIAHHDGNGVLSTDFSYTPENLFCGYRLEYNDNDYLTGILMSYGCDQVNVKNGKRFRFAVAFSRPQTSSRFDFTKLVTNLAEFGVYAYVPNPEENTDVSLVFSR